MANEVQSEYKHSLTFRVRRCCRSLETSVAIANPLNNAQLEGIPTIPNLHLLCPCSSVKMRRRTDTKTAVTTVHFASGKLHAKCNIFLCAI